MISSDTLDEEVYYVSENKSCSGSGAERIIVVVNRFFSQILKLPV